MSAHIDRFVLGDGENLPPTKILECKTANPFAQQEWGEAGSDQVPMGYLAQCIWYMAITNIEHTDLAVLFGNSDFRIYHIERDKEIEALVLEKASDFWINHVLSDIPPSMQTTADYQPPFSKEASGKTVEAQENIILLLSRFHSLKEEIETREKQIDDIKQCIMAQMKDAEVLTYQDKVLATWKKPKPSYRFDSKRFQAEHSDLYPLYQLPIAKKQTEALKLLIDNKHDKKLIDLTAISEDLPLLGSNYITHTSKQNYLKEDAQKINSKVPNPNIPKSIAILSRFIEKQTIRCAEQLQIDQVELEA